MWNDTNAKKVYVVECMGSRLVGRPWKRWIDSVNYRLEKKGLNIGQARRMVYDRKMAEVWEGNAWGITHPMNP